MVLSNRHQERLNTALSGVHRGGGEGQTPSHRRTGRRREEFPGRRSTSVSGRETISSSLHFWRRLSQPMRGRAHPHAPAHSLPCMHDTRAPCRMAVQQTSGICAAMFPLTTSRRNAMRRGFTERRSLTGSAVRSPFSGSRDHCYTKPLLYLLRVS